MYQKLFVDQNKDYVNEQSLKTQENLLTSSKHYESIISQIYTVKNIYN